MLTRRRIVIAVTAVVILGAAYSFWQALQTKQDLERAERSVTALRAAIDADDPTARDKAIADFRDAAATARDRTDGPWWGAQTYLPFLGDDVAAVRVLSSAIDRIAADGVGPLVDSIDQLEGLTADGQIDLEVVRNLEAPVRQANDAFGSAADDINALDASGYVGVLETRFDDFSDQVNGAASGLQAAETAIDVLPDMVGAEGPRDYLLIFQNNAEIRATGGMPGSWAQIRAEDGHLKMRKQGVAGDFPTADQPVLPLSDAEIELYGPEIGTYFQDPGFTPDFPRAAELWNAHWQGHFKNVELEGVLAIDPVALSYILEGTGPVIVDDVTLTPDNVTEELLSRPYLELEPEEQDALFTEAAAAVFDAATGDLVSPVRFVEGLTRAAREGRFLVAPFDEEVAKRLGDSEVVGAMSTTDGRTPYVDIGLNDATGSKMSYYLRYWVEIEPTTCAQNRQQLAATMTLNQSIRPEDAAGLPVSVTGGGFYGTDPGNQLVALRIYAPTGGTIEDVRFDGEPVPIEEHVVDLDGRPAVTLAVSITSREDLDVTWQMTTGEGQSGDIQLGMTPSVVPGSKDATIESACPPQ